MKQVYVSITNISDKIDYLCRNTPSAIEWSGLLLFRSSAIEDNIVQIHAIDIIPMDIGNSVFTSFDSSSKNIEEDVLINHFMNYPDHCDCSVGLIHSHHNMEVFFSDTDSTELHEGAKNKNYYLSLIVNNAGHRTAKLSILGKFANIIDGEYMAINDNGENWKLINNPVSVKDEKYVDFDCEIYELPLEEPIIDEYFIELVNNIVENYNSKPAWTNYPSYISTPTNQKFDWWGELSDDLRGWESRNFIKESNDLVVDGIALFDIIYDQINADTKSNIKELIPRILSIEFNKVPSHKFNSVRRELIELCNDEIKCIKKAMKAGFCTFKTIESEEIKTLKLIKEILHSWK